MSRGRRFDQEEMKIIVDEYRIGADTTCLDCGEALQVQKKWTPILGASSSERFYATCTNCGANGQLQGS